jgi:uncharacterized protein YndB with AHSA1/START domain
MKEKVELEYTLNASPKVLFPRLSTPAGLSEWFADDVNLVGKVYTFIWEGAEQRAEMIARKDNKYVRFRWLEEDENEFFEFRINTDDLTGDTALVIVDFIEEDEIDEMRDLWESQVSELKHAIGL